MNNDLPTHRAAQERCPAAPYPAAMRTLNTGGGAEAIHRARHCLTVEKRGGRRRRKRSSRRTTEHERGLSRLAPPHARPRACALGRLPTRRQRV